MTRYPPHQIIDNFLPDNLHRALLDYALANEEKFKPTSVRAEGEDGYDPGMRQSWACEDRLGPFEDSVGEAIAAKREQWQAELGIPPFELARVELELVAHRQGSFFIPHIDTFTRADRGTQKTDRVLTTVYYFHRQPKRFTGGELALFPFGEGEPRLLEPADNRLVAFPSFAMHEVKPITCPPEDDFADARFAVNCWLHRARAPAQS